MDKRFFIKQIKRLAIHSQLKSTQNSAVKFSPHRQIRPNSTLNQNEGVSNCVFWTCRDASSCQSFDNLAFRYSDPAKLTQSVSADVFVRLLRFIRLWKKLGWTIEQTDAAICALYRADLTSLDANDIDDVGKLNTGFVTLLARLGIVIRVIEALNLTVKRDLLSLLACWSDIGARGYTSLYSQMFLNPALLEQDAVFADDGYGEFLRHVAVAYAHTQPVLEQPIITAASGKIGYNDSTKQLSFSGIMDATIREALKSVPGVSQQLKDAVDALYNAQRLATHAEALRSAFNLTGEEYDRIVAGLVYDASTALTIPNISAIYRRGWLARKLNFSVRELLLLIQFTSLDPFAVPDPAKSRDPAVDLPCAEPEGSSSKDHRRALSDLESGSERQVRSGLGPDCGFCPNPAPRFYRGRDRVLCL